jgi:hypoxanthine-guanine phosphoribosyltransferase
MLQLVSLTNKQTMQQPPLLVVYLHGTLVSARRLFHNSHNCLVRTDYIDIQEYEGKEKNWTEYSIQIRLEKQNICEYETK